MITITTTITTAATQVGTCCLTANHLLTFLPPFKIVLKPKFNVNSPISSPFLFNPTDEEVGDSSSDAWFADFVPHPQKPLTHLFPSVMRAEQVGNFIGNPFWCRGPTNELWHDNFAEDSVRQSERSEFEDIDSLPTKPMGLQAIQKPHPKDND
jgi:hypothetical protein